MGKHKSDLLFWLLFGFIFVVIIWLMVSTIVNAENGEDTVKRRQTRKTRDTGYIPFDPLLVNTSVSICVSLVDHVCRNGSGNRFQKWLALQSRQLLQKVVTQAPPIEPLARFHEACTKRDPKEAELEVNHLRDTILAPLRSYDDLFPTFNKLNQYGYTSPLEEMQNGLFYVNHLNVSVPTLLNLYQTSGRFDTIHTMDKIRRLQKVIGLLLEYPAATLTSLDSLNRWKNLELMDWKTYVEFSILYNTVVLSADCISLAEQWLPGLVSSAVQPPMKFPVASKVAGQEVTLYEFPVEPFSVQLSPNRHEHNINMARRFRVQNPLKYANPVSDLNVYRRNGTITVMPGLARIMETLSPFEVPLWASLLRVPFLPETDETFYKVYAQTCGPTVAIELSDYRRAFAVCNNHHHGS